MITLFNDTFKKRGKNIDYFYKVRRCPLSPQTLFIEESALTTVSFGLEEVNFIGEYRGNHNQWVEIKKKQTVHPRHYHALLTTEKNNTNAPSSDEHSHLSRLNEVAKAFLKNNNK